MVVFSLCLSQSLLSDELHLIMLIDLLDGSLTLSRYNMEHFKVLQLCHFFRLKQCYILPMLKASLCHKYALFYEEFTLFALYFSFMSGCGQTNCTRVGLFKGHTILPITMIKNKTIHSPFLHFKSTVHPALASRGFASHIISSINK